ncbi:ABC transporter substrate-binding protein [Oscillospiraceae bacterium LTW-04]|nr:ABC transporter substrate-binding protein [Oscillospiraceae bacterium MB24-C1]
MIKRILAILMVLALFVALFAGCGQTVTTSTAKPEPAAETSAAAPAPETSPSETREFTDSCGRTVTLPSKITKIAVSGPLTQLYVLPLCPELMVGFASDFSEDASLYIKNEYLALPKLGQLYGGKGTMDLEALLAAGPDVVIDVGEAKGSIVEDMDALTNQTGIPFVHIDATVTTAGDAYRMLGELTGKAEKANELASWCESAYTDITAMMAKVDADGARKSLLYCLGDKGINVIAEGSFHAQTINMLSKNLATLSEVASSGMGNEVDLEQILLWNPEVIIFSPNSIYDTVGSDTAWQQLSAISSGNYFKVPDGPYGWVSSPPSVQCYLGMLWLGALLYPDYVDYDLQTEVTGYYKLFYDCDLSAEMYRNLTADSLSAA